MAGKRVVYWVQFKMPNWQLLRGKEVIFYASKKARVVTEASIRCKEAHEKGEKCQLKIRKTDGTIQSERTYGDDPKRSKG